MSRQKYDEFIETPLGKKSGKRYPWTEEEYVGITCPGCNNMFVEITTQSLKASKASNCLKHLQKSTSCQAVLGRNVSEAPEKKVKVTKQDGDGLVTIYKLVFKRENRAVYTGRTKNIETRFKQHASKSSSCRLVRNAVRRNGIDQFSIEPIVKCQPADADANESYYIMANNTMHPNGYNLRHGSTAGEDSDEETRVATSTRGIVSFKNVTDQLQSQMDATADMMKICEDLDDCSSVNEVCRDLLRDVHPDRAGERSFSANDVAAMLNAVRESVRE